MMTHIDLFSVKIETALINFFRAYSEQISFAVYVEEKDYAGFLTLAVDGLPVDLSLRSSRRLRLNSSSLSSSQSSDNKTFWQTRERAVRHIVVDMLLPTFRRE
jgi:hypothetical protein